MVYVPPYSDRSSLLILIKFWNQAYFSAASDLHSSQMQALFTAYSTAVKKPAEDDSVGGNILWFKNHDADSFPGFAVPQTALAPKTALRRVGTARKSAVDKGGASDNSLTAAEVSLLRRKSRNLGEINVSCRFWDTYWMK